MMTKQIILNSAILAKSFLEQNFADETHPEIKKCSSFHDVIKFPDMQLAATYNATHALILLGKNLSDEKQSLIEYVSGFQTRSGAFRMPQIKSCDIWKGISVDYSQQYIDNHITNYAMGMISSLGGSLKYPLYFMHDLLDEQALSNWLDRRDLTNPWLEGNNIVNLASFIIHELEGTDDDLLSRLMDVLFKWHDDNQDANTGYWGTDSTAKRVSVLEGMAGAAHNFHLYYYFNRPIPHYKEIIDYCLDFVREGVHSACLDIDVVDILVNFIVFDYRVEEIKNALADFAIALCKFQNSDGGFADEKNGQVRRMDGWVYGYWEPQGLSNCFGTWFRMATLAMISCVLYPETKDLWTFRNTIGIGYFNKNYLRK